MTDDGPAFDDFANYYDMADIDRAPETAFYCGLIGGGARSLLELCCGTGTITLPMAEILRKAGAPEARIVGVDESDKMLDIARRRAPDIEWLKGDMRDPPVQGSFDVVVCCFHGFQLLLSNDDLMRAFRSVRALMSAEGIFAFDIYQPNMQFLTAQHPERQVRAFTDDKGRRLEVLELSDYDAAARVLMTDWRLVDSDRPGAAPIARMRVPMRQYFAEEIEQMLAATGLVMRERYGDYDRSPFTSTSKRQVIVCHR